MAQPQYPSMPPSAFSPPAASPSPGTPQQQSQFPLPPNKRQRLSPGPISQPSSPYVQSPYGISPNVSAPPSAGASPHFSNVALPPNVYNTPYSNGHNTPSLNLPQAQPSYQTPQYQSSISPSNQNQVNPQGNYNNFAMPPQHPGTMGPPSKPEKPRDDMDVMDVLGGTGIDLREEEQYTFQMQNTSFNSQLSGSQSGTISSGHSYTQFPPGDEATFFGAGPANAAAEKSDTKSQEALLKKAADKAWHDAAHNLATSRQLELANPFLEVGLVHSKMAKIARENGLELLRNPDGSMGQMRLPETYTQRSVWVQTAVGPNGALVATNGTFMPSDTQVVDQLALLSIASKHRLRELIEDAATLSKGRQTGSHGIIPEDWADAGSESHVAATSVVVEGTPRSGWESAVSPNENPRKRSFSATNKVSTSASDSGKKTSSTKTTVTNEVAVALRTAAVKERDAEEARLRKRQARASGNVPRAQSAIPGTPGSVAPEIPDKAPTKKEQRKKNEAKISEAATHAATNQTMSFILGGKKKKYSWMTGGAGGASSGASTPGRITTQGLPGTPGGGASAPPEKLTADSVRRVGTWREDREKGVGIQIRDWITVLEGDGHEKKALQRAYLWLDLSEPK